MLVLQRRAEESVCIGDDITVTVLSTGRRRVRLGIEAPRHVNIRRSTTTDDPAPETDDQTDSTDITELVAGLELDFSELSEEARNAEYERRMSYLMDAGELTDSETYTESELADMLWKVSADKTNVLEQFLESTRRLPKRHFGLARDAFEQTLETLDFAQRSVAEARAYLRRLEQAAESSDDASPKMRSAFEYLCKHPRVRAVDHENDQLVIYLETITITCCAKRRFEIGDFALQCDLVEQEVTTRCLRSTNPYEEHPHGYSFGICFGDSGGRQLGQFLAQADYHALVDLAINMMTQPHYALHELSDWKEVPLEDPPR